MMLLPGSLPAALRLLLVGLLASAWLGLAQAGLFDDEEARKAILELRNRIATLQADSERRLADENKRAVEDTLQLRSSLVQLQNQIEALRADLARLQGQNEQYARSLSDMQRQQKDFSQAMEERVRKIEPVKVVVDGREFVAGADEKRDYENALSVFRKGEFEGAQGAFVDFLKRYPQSGYHPSALFWLGNAQYATRDYKEAMINFRALLALVPDHLRAPEAMLSIANCQIELKDSKAARKTLEDLIKAFPQSEASGAARDRLARLK